MHNLYVFEVGVASTVTIVSMMRETGQYEMGIVHFDTAPMCLPSVRAVTMRQIGILHIACKMFTIYCCIAVQMWLLLNQ